MLESTYIYLRSEFSCLGYLAGKVVVSGPSLRVAPDCRDLLLQGFRELVGYLRVASSLVLFFSLVLPAPHTHCSSSPVRPVDVAWVMSQLGGLRKQLLVGLQTLHLMLPLLITRPPAAETHAGGGGGTWTDS